MAGPGQCYCPYKSKYYYFLEGDGIYDCGTHIGSQNKGQHSAREIDKASWEGWGFNLGEIFRRKLTLAFLFVNTLLLE